MVHSPQPGDIKALDLMSEQVGGGCDFLSCSLANRPLLKWGIAGIVSSGQDLVFCLFNSSGQPGKGIIIFRFLIYIVKNL